MFCKHCGQQIADNSKFCSVCGKSLVDPNESTPTKLNDPTPFILEESVPTETPIPIQEESTDVQNSIEPFFQLSTLSYCSNCGIPIGKNKSCPNCHFPKKNNVQRFCSYCGSTVKNGACISSHVLIEKSLAEKILKGATLCAFILCSIGFFINLFTGAFLSATILLLFSLPLLLFVTSSRQIYKIKRLLYLKNIKQIWICFIYVLVIVIVLLGIKISTLPSSTTLTGDDLAAYELIVDASYDFKDPSSVRLVSGTVFYDEDDHEYSGWFALSATNGFGARTVGYYFVSYLDGDAFALDLEEYGDSTSIKYAKTQDELNVDQINKALEEKWN